MTDADDDVRRVRRPGGIEIPYRVFGAGGAPRMVYAHALTGSGLLTASVTISPFLDAGWSIAAIDQRGHHQATASLDPDAYRVEALGADLIAVMDDLGWPSAWLCGASMGAAPSIAAAVSSPERVDGLILLAPAFGEERNAAADMFARVADALASGGIEAGAEVWRTEMRAREVPEAGIEGHIAQLRLHDPAAMAVWLREIGAWTLPDAIAALPEVDVPVAAVAWEDDDIHPASLAERIANSVPRGTFEVLDLGRPDAGPDLLFRVALEGVNRIVDQD